MKVQEGFRHHDKSAIRLACLCGNSGFEFGQVVNRCCNRRQCDGRGGSFNGAQVVFEIWRRNRVEQESDSNNVRCDLLEQLQPLGGVVDSTALNPVTLPPGRGKLATMPLPTGSDTFPKMMGMVRVCCITALVVGVFCARMRSGCSAMSSFAKRCINSTSAAPQRISIQILRPSVHPS